MEDTAHNFILTALVGAQLSDNVNISLQNYLQTEGTRFYAFVFKMFPFLFWNIRMVVGQ